MKKILLSLFLCTTFAFLFLYGNSIDVNAASYFEPYSWRNYVPSGYKPFEMFNDSNYYYVTYYDKESIDYVESRSNVFTSIYLKNTDASCIITLGETKTNTETTTHSGYVLSEGEVGGVGKKFVYSVQIGGSYIYQKTMGTSFEREYIVNSNDKNGYYYFTQECKYVDLYCDKYSKKTKEKVGSSINKKFLLGHDLSLSFSNTEPVKRYNDMINTNLSKPTC